MMTVNGLVVEAGSSLGGLIVFKGTALAALGLAASRLARRSRAAVRHTLLAVSFGAMLLLPIASGSVRFWLSVSHLKTCLCSPSYRR